MASPEFVKGIYTGHRQCRRVCANDIDVVTVYVEEDCDCKLAIFV